MIRKPLKGYPIREKRIKGHIYLYQVTRAWRDPTTGAVKKTERYLGAVISARPKPVLDQLDATDTSIITSAWRRGEDMSWIQTYLRTGAGIKDVPEPNTIYKWLRKNGITRGARPRAPKRIAVIEQRLERIKSLRKEAAEIKARQARQRIIARKEIEGRIKK